MRDSGYRGHRPRNAVALDAWHRQACPAAALHPEMPVFDCHHHLYGSLSDPHYYRLEDFAADLEGGHRMLGTLYVEAYEFGWRETGPRELRSIGEVDRVEGLTAVPVSTRSGLCRVAAGIVSHVDMMLGDDMADVVRLHLEAGKGRLRGVRHRAATDEGTIGRFMGERPRPHLMSERPFQQAVARLSGLGLPFDAWVYCTQLEDVIGLADAAPDTVIVLDHVGGLLGVAEHALRQGELREHWRAVLFELAKRPNVRVKIGGLGTVECGFGFEAAAMPPTAERLAEAWRPIIQTCLEAFGSRRSMFESNFPVDKQSCGYTELWNAFKIATATLSTDERCDLFYRTACTTYGLPDLARAGDRWLAAH